MNINIFHVYLVLAIGLIILDGIALWQGQTASCLLLVVY